MCEEKRERGGLDGWIDGFFFCACLGMRGFGEKGVFDREVVGAVYVQG